MKIQDFCDMNKFEQIMKNWANRIGFAWDYSKIVE